MLKRLSINVPLIEALEQMLGMRLRHCSAIATRSTVQRRKITVLSRDPMYYRVATTLLRHCVILVLASNLMPLSIYKKLECRGSQSQANHGY
ncbi:hypothetical protein H5410_030653 [Solanum commersonii]|uniref:Uncharacterized protein n=1 Tax=Solanum commersonii TaxID=4109 RepID=A0A9J5YEW5_SOLCO|nr:hypothetical protein H5410_030653 [Solanum commersonii]